MSEATASKRPANDDLQNDAKRQNFEGDESTWVSLRAILSGREASVVIGTGGDNVARIRQLAAARISVSDNVKGAIDRVLTCSGTPENVAKAFGLMVRTLNGESLEGSSNETSKSFTLRLAVSDYYMGSVIGKAGSRIKELQEQSGARVTASDGCLPLSTERTVVIAGVADAIHIAVFHLGKTIRDFAEKFTVALTVPYNPLPTWGLYGHWDTYGKNRVMQTNVMSPANPYGVPMGTNVGQMAAYGNLDPSIAMAQQQFQQPQAQGQVQARPGPAAQPGQPITQQIYIPNDMVGAIIGKGGAKINEIRQMSGSHIKINEPSEQGNERLVTITGTQECNQMALYMLYSRLESEKHRM